MKFYLAIILSLALLTPSSALAAGASFKLVSDKKNTMRIVVDSATTPINSVGAIINYNPKLVSVSGLDFSDSFCSLFVEKKIDKRKGQIRILCGKPGPAFGVNNVAIIKYTGANSSMSLDPQSQILAHDGHGTNIYNLK